MKPGKSIHHRRIDLQLGWAGLVMCFSLNTHLLCMALCLLLLTAREHGQRTCRVENTWIGEPYGCGWSAKRWVDGRRCVEDLSVFVVVMFCIAWSFFGGHNRGQQLRVINEGHQWGNRSHQLMDMDYIRFGSNQVINCVYPFLKSSKNCRKQFHVTIFYNFTKKSFLEAEHVCGFWARWPKHVYLVNVPLVTPGEYKWLVPISIKTSILQYKLFCNNYIMS